MVRFDSYNRMLPESTGVDIWLKGAHMGISIPGKIGCRAS